MLKSRKEKHWTGKGKKRISPKDGYCFGQSCLGILAYLMVKPNASFAELRELTGFSPNSISRYMYVLKKHGLISYLPKQSRTTVVTCKFLLPKQLASVATRRKLINKKVKECPIQS